MVKWLPVKRFLGLFSARYADIAALERSLALYKRGAYEKAYAILQDVISRHPDWRLGDAYVLCANLESVVNDDTSKAAEVLDEALRRGCRHDAAYYNVSGRVFWRLGERDRGIREMERAVDLDPGVYYLQELGRALACDGDMRAMDVWKRVLEQEPSNCLAYVHLGILAAMTGDRAKALLMAKRAEGLRPTARELFDIGELYATAGEFQMALDRFAEADRLGVGPSGPLFADIAACHFELGNIQEGCEYLEKGRVRFPNSACVKEVWNRYRKIGKAGDGNDGDTL
jgi:tetratricopeptide (TPR) repeat protein